MKKRNRSINLLLMDEVANGLVKCSLANWTGLTYKIPRTELDKCKEIPALKQTGVYFLFGRSDETGEEVVYVGQAGIRKNGEGILLRLLEHRKNEKKDYWTEAVVFTTSNDSFGPTEISYLENQFCNMAKDANRYTVKNSNDPTPGNITEEKKCELDEFIDFSTTIMKTLGHQVFVPLVSNAKEDSANSSSTVVDDEPLFYFNRTAGKASGRRSAEGFVVLEGSVVSAKLQASCPENVKKVREFYAKIIDNQNVLTDNVLLTSPSAAAAFVGGSSYSGNLMWKTEDGRTLKEVEEAEGVLV